MTKKYILIGMIAVLLIIITTFIVFIHNQKTLSSQNNSSKTIFPSINNPLHNWEVNPFIADYKETQINEYLKYNGFGDISVYGWKFVNKVKSHGTIIDFKYNNKKVSFLELADNYKIEFNCHNQAVPISFYMKSHRLSSDPVGYILNFDQVKSVCIPSTCSNDLDKIDLDCICSLSTKSLVSDINNRLDSIINSNLEWFTKEIKDNSVKAKSDFANSIPSCHNQEIYIASYNTADGPSATDAKLRMAIDKDSNILGFIDYSRPL